MADFCVPNPLLKVGKGGDFKRARAITNRISIGIGYGVSKGIVSAIRVG